MLSNIIIPDDGLRNTWLSRHYNFGNPPSVAGAQAAYEKGEDWLHALVGYLDQNFAYTKAYLGEHLPKAKFEISEATYPAWADLSAYFGAADDLPMFFANNAGVLLEGGNMIAQNSGCFSRLDLALPQASLAEGLKRIGNAMNTK